MCYDDADASDLWFEHTHKARVIYRCSECGGAILRASKYVRIAAMDSGKWSTLRVHDECMKLWRLVQKNLCGGKGTIIIGGLDLELDGYEPHGVEDKQDRLWRRYRRRYDEIQKKYSAKLGEERP